MLTIQAPAAPNTVVPAQAASALAQPSPPRRALQVVFCQMPDLHQGGGW